MPLLAKMLPLRKTVEDVHASALSSQHHQQEKSVREEKDTDSGYEDFQDFDDDQCLDSDMEGSVDSILHRGRPKKVQRAPAIPTPNERLASTILDNVMLELKALDGTTSKEPDNRSTMHESDPHESYLSSEEDASLSDDYDDTNYSIYEYSGTSSPSLKGTTSEAEQTKPRKSQEDTARVVSFISVGKPQIVDIYIHSNHTSPVSSTSSCPAKRHSMNLDTLTTLTQSSPSAKTHHRPTPLKIYPSSIRRVSISSITSSQTSTSSTTNPSNTVSHPPRKSSRLANLTSLVTHTKNSLLSQTSSRTPPQTHQFLTSDPFPNSSESSQQQQQQQQPRPEDHPPTTPKTPTSMAAQAWKRTLNKARRPSMPKLSLAYANASMTNLSSSPSSSYYSPDKRTSRRVSTSHSNVGFSKDGLARIISENSSRTSVYSSSGSSAHDASYVQAQAQPKFQTSSLKTSESVAEESETSTVTSYIPLTTQQSISILSPKMVAPPVPATSSSNNNSNGNGNGRRSFGFGVGMGLGRRKSLKGR